jgi:hypothetical protein
MKRIFLLLAFFLCCSSALMAEIIVNAEGKVQKYPDGSTLNVVAAKNLIVDYYGINVFVPKGEKISVRCSEVDEGNAVYCSGEGFKNVKIGSDTIYSDKEVSFVVTPNGDLTVEKGNLVITNQKGNVAILEQGNTYKVDIALNPRDSFVPVSVTKVEAYEQAEKDSVLSPSSPRN